MLLFLSCLKKWPPDYRNDESKHEKQTLGWGAGKEGGRGREGGRWQEEWWEVERLGLWGRGGGIDIFRTRFIVDQVNFSIALKMDSNTYITWQGLPIMLIKLT